MKTKSSLFIACHFIKTIKAITVFPYPAFISKQQFPFPYLLSDLPIVSGLKHHLCVCGMFTPLRLCIKLITFDVVIKTQSGKMTMAWKVWTVEERNVEVGTGAYVSCIRKFLQVTWRGGYHWCRFTSLLPLWHPGIWKGCLSISHHVVKLHPQLPNVRWGPHNTMG